MIPRLTRLAAAMGMALLLQAAALANDMTFDQVRRPPVAFLEHGDVIGISERAHRSLGISEGDLVEVTTPLGTSIVVPTRIHGDLEDAVFARKTIRDSLNIEDGRIALRVRPYRQAESATEASPGQQVTFTRVRRPPEAFLQYGDVVGIAAAGLGRLGIEEGQTILLQAPNGNTLAARTKIHGTEGDTLFLKKTMRDQLGIEDGSITLAVSSVQWPSADPVTETQPFRRVGRPPASFLELGDVVGMSYEDMVRSNARPGDEATLTTSGGSLDATIEILDREPGTLFMKLTMRRQLGISDGSANVDLRITGRGSVSASDQEDALYWYRRLDTAQARAREEARPLMVFAYRDGHSDSAAVLSTMEDSWLRRDLMKARKFRFDAGENDLLSRQYNINRVPTLLFLYPDGREIGRFEGQISADRIRAGITHSERLVREANPGVRDSDLE
ncbi:MAG: thioredoxin family protein [Candidatus Sumerlaeia bacterium]|nr:thioredoxin family protein [Candidatus Sumerlaeia bacterium]